MKRLLGVCTLLAAFLVVATSSLAAQGVTTSSIRGQVRSTEGAAIGGARVTALHEPSGTSYIGTSLSDGRVTIPGMRVGGPYRVTVSAIGFEPTSRESVYLSLGIATELTFAMRAAAVTLQDITATALANNAFSSTRTGASTQISQEMLATLPTISRSITDLTRLTPQSTGSSFAGQDPRMNNIMIDGSYFNNSFGLRNAPGVTAGVAPIPLDAIEQMQVNIAPFDVRQGNFVGAGVNAVTKSGTNEFSGSAYFQYRNESFVGTKAGENTFNPGTFTYDQIGARLGGPIIRNKLFFFANYEKDNLEQPGTTFEANAGGETVGGNITRVLASDLETLSSFVSENFGYETGPYEGYSSATPSTRFLARMDFNASERHKFSLRYTHLDAITDNLVSNSTSLGFGNRRTNANAMSYENSGYGQLENIRSLVGEWNASLGSNMANNMIIGYTSNDESREPKAGVFPAIDILKDGLTYMNLGTDPFTPSNQLRYKSIQFQNNFTIFGNRHDLTFGVSAERYEAENVFFPGSQSVYVYNSLDDFYLDANDQIANPNRTVSPVALERFQLRWSNIPGQDEPLQPTEVFYAGVYAQDEWRATDNFTLTGGVRIDAPNWKETGLENPLVNDMTFRDETGADVQYNTSALPDTKLHFSPRLGFNWDVKGDRSTQVRGGTGVFTGRPAYVWISNQIGANGMLTGFERVNGTTARPFSPDIDRHKPAEVTGAPASQYELAFTDLDFKFPQLWRTNIAIDQRIAGGWVATGEFLYNKDVNGIYYINANLAEPNAAYTGADQRPRWTSTAASRINGNIDNAIVMSNQDVGKSWNVAGSLERSFNNGFYAKVAYAYGETKNTVDPGSIAFGSWSSNAHSGDPNNPGLGYSANSPGHRFFTALSYRKNWANFGATTVSLFFEGATIGNASYLFAADANGDGGTNDLIYIPVDQTEMNFQTYNATVSGQTVTFTAEQQAAAWDAYIEQDEYLSARRGEYAGRGGVFLPMVWRADLSIAQELFTRVGGKLNRLQVRLDILNFSNLLNKSWGTGQRLVSNQPLTNPSVDGNGALRYRLRQINGELMNKTFEKTAGVNDVFRLQLGVRYIFN
jgi:outer membrane receptor for ferrienterochelin and colicin